MFSSKKTLLVLLLALLAITLFASVKANKVNIDINPNPVKDDAVISVFVDKDVEGTISIIDEKGIVVKTIYSGLIIEGTTHYNWDRTNYANVRLPEGKYVLELTSESKFTSVKKIIILK